jgi:hypothetical protein
MLRLNSFIAAVAFLTFPVAAANAACNTQATHEWVIDTQRKLSVEAIAEAPRCPKAVVLLVIRNEKGDPLWIEASKAKDVFTFAEAKPNGPLTMTAALQKWIAKDARLLQADILPAWKKVADAPEKAKNPFYVDEGLSRADYLAMREAKLPMLCFVAGMESQTCLVLTKDGSLQKIGSWPFAG